MINFGDHFIACFPRHCSHQKPVGFQLVADLMSIHTFIHHAGHFLAIQRKILAITFLQPEMPVRKGRNRSLTALRLEVGSSQVFCGAQTAISSHSTHLLRGALYVRRFADKRSSLVVVNHPHCSFDAWKRARRRINLSSSSWSTLSQQAGDLGQFHPQLLCHRTSWKLCSSRNLWVKEKALPIAGDCAHLSPTQPQLEAVWREAATVLLDILTTSTSPRAWKQQGQADEQNPSRDAQRHQIHKCTPF